MYKHTRTHVGKSPFPSGFGPDSSNVLIGFGNEGFLTSFFVAAAAGLDIRSAYEICYTSRVPWTLFTAKSADFLAFSIRQSNFYIFAATAATVTRRSQLV